MPKAAAVAPITTIEMVPIGKVFEWEGNPRKTFDGLEELAQDVKLRGVLQPVLVRPILGGYQLVFGARRYRAAKLAGLDVIPAMVRELSDVEALEVALVENAKRSDVHPLEEADAYRELHTKHGYDVDTIAAKVGKSRAAVYARLKLVELGEAGRKAFFDGKLNASTALLVARIPDQEAQAKAVQEIAEDNWSGPMSVREATEYVQQHHTQDLKRAPFDTADEFLLAEAGPCTGCPKNSGANPDLLGDLGADVCTDGKCFKLKVAAAAENKKSAALAAGHQVLEGKAAEKALSYGGGYVKLDERCFEDPKDRTYGQLLKKAEVEKVVAIDSYGAARELVPAREALKAIKESTTAEWTNRLHVPGDRGAGGGMDEAQRKAREKQLIENRARRRAIGMIVQNLDDRIELERELWDVLLESQLQFGWAETLKEVADRRELDRKSSKDVQTTLRNHAKGLNDYQIRSLVFELAITRQGYGHKDLVAVAGAPFDVDLKELEREERQAKKQKKTAPAKKSAEPLDDGKRCGIRDGKSGPACILEQGHDAQHSTGTRTWSARKPKKGRAA